MIRAFILLVSFFFVQNIYSQDVKATPWEEKRATLFSSYIAEQMEMNEKDKDFVHRVMLDRIVNARTQIRGKNLTQENKKRVFRSEYAKAQARLVEHFDTKTARKIMSLSNEARKMTDTR